MTCRLEVDGHGLIWVVGGKRDVKLEAAARVRRVGRASDEHLDGVEALLSCAQLNTSKRCAMLTPSGASQESASTLSEAKTQKENKM